MGRAMTLRTQPDKQYDRTRKELGHRGPYLPILLEACQEQQLSYEYRDGVTSYGAYTFSMAKVLRENRARGINLSFADLNELVKAKLQRLKYDQTPNLVGPKALCAEQVPWRPAAQRAAGGQVSGRRTARGRKRAKKTVGRRHK
jgi:hypothetical protein